MHHPAVHSVLPASAKELAGQPRAQTGRCSMTLGQMMAMAARAHRLSKPTPHRPAARPTQPAVSLSADEWTMLFATRGLSAAPAQ